MTRSKSQKARTLKGLSIVIPVFNEEKVLGALRNRLEPLMRKLSVIGEVIFVSDGSVDATCQIIEEWAAEDSRVKLVEFSRNFGHQFAITAGIDSASLDAVVVMDGDLQDPPELIEEMVAKYEAGFDVVYAQRVSRQTDSFFKRFSARVFYRFMNMLLQRPLPPHVADFRLMSRPFVETLAQIRESHRYIRGLTVWAGYNQVCIPVVRAARAAGETKYPLRKMVKLALDAIISFSGVPLRMVSFAGLLVCVLGFSVAAHAIYQKFSGQLLAPGWTSLFVLICVVGGFTLLGIGAVGEYIARIYEESKQRPLYIVKRTVNFDRVPARARSVWNTENSNRARATKPKKAA